ncbi:zinc finger, CCHC-type containing protein [Tanacetum coccineum]|uniref:Zinc finger, CCHC-type containing protein n=1 Tax=Tanacetum coccineum TaxID=301880 RepID=A0ABQ5FQM4_9ASTR
MHKLRRAASHQQQNDSLAIAGRNLFDDEPSTSANPGPKPTPPLKILREHSSPNSAGIQNPIVLPVKQTRNIIDTRDIGLIQGVCTFQGEAKKWLDMIPPSQITTWEQLVSKFLDKFFPPGRTSTIRDMILRFRQMDKEHIKDAWIHFQDLIRQAPHHGVNKWLLVQIFYDNISPNDRNGIDYFAQYRFSQLNEEEGWNRIEEYVQYQDDTWEEPTTMNISFISEVIKPTFEGRMKKAQDVTPPKS